VYHLTSLEAQNVFLKFRDLYDTRLQIQGHVVHLTKKNTAPRGLTPFHNSFKMKFFFGCV
jgi:hypothetical protein